MYYLLQIFSLIFNIWKTASWTEVGVVDVKPADGLHFTVCERSTLNDPSTDSLHQWGFSVGVDCGRLRRQLQHETDGARATLGRVHRVCEPAGHRQTQFRNGATYS